ncbi:MAG: FGGY family carbohydrate kinase, partial [Halieaceae bacterium]|nr:FGGY family carbohydrate kinase [Halieaceae bacterium]
MSRYILAIDQGTTGTTVALVDHRGQIRDAVNHEFPQIYPQPGWVEHRPEDIWNSVLKGIRSLLRRKHCKPGDIAAIGITNQRETALLWDARQDEALYNAIVWQCRRTTPQCEALRSEATQALVKRRSGLVLDPYFSATKWAWLLQHAPRARASLKAGQLRAGTVDSSLVWKLSDGQDHVTDVSNASRTLAMNLRRGAWDTDLLKLFGVPREILPRIVPSSGVMSYTRGVPGLPDGIPIAGMAGDQQSALFGQACFSAGDAKATFG